MNIFSKLWQKYKDWKEQLDKNIAILNEQQRIADLNREPLCCRFCQGDHLELGCPWVV